MDNLCIHCLNEGDWTDEDKCPQCTETGHISPWSVGGCPACNKEYFDKMKQLSGDKTLSFDREGDWIQTYTGKRFFPFDPRPEEICIEDVAHSLSMQCRFTGHTKKHYSIAQHSILVSQNCLGFELWGLLHDASEAYLSDIARPVKRHKLFKDYKDVEKKVMEVVCIRFGLPVGMPDVVRQADEMLLVTEARDLMGPLLPGWVHTVENGYPALEQKIVPWEQEEVEHLFLARYYELTLHGRNRATAEQVYETRIDC